MPMSTQSVGSLPAPVNPEKPKFVSPTRGRKLMRTMVRHLESKFGNPPRLPIYTAAK